MYMHNPESVWDFEIQRIGTGNGCLGNKRTSGDHSTKGLLRSAKILRIVQETGGDLLSLQLLWGNHRLTLV